MRLFLDLETYSEVPIQFGTYRYAESAEIMLWAWAVDDGPVQVWDLTAGAPMPPDLGEALMLAGEVWAHNSMFDRTVIRHQFQHLCPPTEVWRDTMVQALCHSLPGGLALLCDVLGVPEDKAKAKRGKQLIQLFCRPRPKTSKLRRATRETHPDQWAEFVHYAANDIEALREILRRVPSWNYRGEELALWHLDQRINDRGIGVDVELAHAAIDAVAREQEALAARTQQMTGGQVASATRLDALLQFMLEEYGVLLPDLQGSTIERRLEDPDIPEPMKDLLRVRLSASTTSTSKYKALANAVNKDGRLRGTLQFAGASRTGRWAGRTFQPQNLPRPSLKQECIDFGIDALKAGVADLMLDDVMALASSAVRGCLVAARGRKFCIADLSNIEGRALAWLAGEEWKLQAFREFDTIIGTDAKGEPIRKGHDLYKLAYAKSFNIAPEDVTKDQRQIGKVQELALGYQGGAGAFATFAAAYNINLDTLAEQMLPGADPTAVQQAEEFLARRKKDKAFRPGMSDRAFVACEVIKAGWRRGHPAISAWWPMLEQAFRDAIESPGYVFDCGTVKVLREGAWLRMRLPSGRYLCYPKPEIDEQGRCSYLGMNQYTKKWSRIDTYAGKVAENCTQAFARDVLVSSMQAIEAEGYQIVLSIHDEFLTETPDTRQFSSDRLAELMSTVPPWAAGLPLAAAGFETYRYRKD